MADDYQLQPWVADDVYYSKLIEEFGKGFYIGIGSGRQRYDLAFKAETLLRSSSSNWRDIGWQIISDYPKGFPVPGMRYGEDLLAFLIEDLLNTQNIKPDELLAIIKKKIQVPWWWEYSYCAEIVESPSKQGDYLIVKNLFGDNQNGSIFYVGGCQGIAVYALRKVDNLFLVEKVRDWQALEIPAAGFKLLLDTVGDVNANGVPEIVIDELFGGSGSPPGRAETIEFYEWDTSKEAFASDSIRMKENICFMYQPCENGWRVEKVNSQGFRPVIINEQYATMYDSIEGESTCDNYIIEHTYLWKNAKFVGQKHSVIPPTDKQVECQLSWAIQGLNRNMDENTIATSLISKALIEWPDTMNDIWGPASKDYFAFRLGLSYDLMGQEEAGLALVRSVTEQPSNPKFTFVSQLAYTYLDERSKHGKVKACEEINLLQRESVDKISNSLYSPYRPVEKLREAWGYGAPIWLYSVDNVCDGKLALELLIRQTQVSEFESLDEWLSRVGLKPLSVQTIFESGA